MLLQILHSFFTNSNLSLYLRLRQQVQVRCQTRPGQEDFPSLGAAREVRACMQERERDKGPRQTAVNKTAVWEVPRAN